MGPGDIVNIYDDPVYGEHLLARAEIIEVKIDRRQRVSFCRVRDIDHGEISDFWVAEDKYEEERKKI